MTSKEASSQEAEKGGVFFLFGEDEFRKERRARRLIDGHLDPSTRDFNYDPLRASSLDLETLASVTGTPPMMAEWRVVLIREAEGLASSAKMRDLVVDLARRPPPGLALILMATIPSGSKARFYQDLRKSARAVEFPAIERDDVPGWILAWGLAEHGVQFDEDAARALAAGLGTDLGILDREIAKLGEHVGDAGRVTKSDVEAAGTFIPRQDRWQWFDLVGERRFPEALPGLQVLLTQGESGVGLVIGLAAHLLRLGLLRSEGAAALEQALPPHQRWLARRLQGQARRWRPEELQRAVHELRRVDQLLKASSFPDVHLLEEWLLGLMARSVEAA